MKEEWQSVLLRVGDIHFSDVLQPSPSDKWHCVVTSLSLSFSSTLTCKASAKHVVT